MKRGGNPTTSSGSHPGAALDQSPTTRAGALKALTAPTAAPAAAPITAAGAGITAAPKPAPSIGPATTPTGTNASPKTSPSAPDQSQCTADQRGGRRDRDRRPGPRHRAHRGGADGLSGDP